MGIRELPNTLRAGVLLLTLHATLQSAGWVWVFVRFGFDAHYELGSSVFAVASFLTPVAAVVGIVRGSKWGYWLGVCFSILLGAYFALIIAVASWAQPGFWTLAACAAVLLLAAALLIAPPSVRWVRTAR